MRFFKSREKAASKPRSARKKIRRQTFSHGRKLKSQTSAFITSFVVTLAVIGLIFGVFIVDRNTRDIGWGTSDTTLAFSSTSTRIGMTVLGENVTIDIGRYKKECAAARDVSLAASFVAPGGLKLLRSAFVSAGRYFSALGVFNG